MIVGLINGLSGRWTIQLSGSIPDFAWIGEPVLSVPLVLQVVDLFLVTRLTRWSVLAVTDVVGLLSRLIQFSISLIALAVCLLSRRTIGIAFCS